MKFKCKRCCVGAAVVPEADSPERKGAAVVPEAETPLRLVTMLTKPTFVQLNRMGVET